MAIPIAQWVADARANLAHAEQVCNDANTYITSTDEKLRRRDMKIPKLIYYLDALKQQLRLLGIIRDSLVMNLNGVMDRRAALQSQLLKDVDRLHRTIDTLKNTVVVFDGQTTLYEYISESGVEELFNGVSQNLRDIQSLIKGNRTDALLIRLTSDLDHLNNELNALDSKFRDMRLGDAQSSSIDPTSKLLEINTELEHDMVAILTSFNNHYDQCEKGEAILGDPEVPQDEKDELVSVLRNDVEELPEVQRSLTSNAEIIKKNCKEVMKILDIFEDYFQRVETYVRDMQEYGESKLRVQLTEFSEISTEVSRRLEIAQTHQEELVQYNGDFQQFVRSYYSLILELDRRTRLNEHISSAIDSFKSNIDSIVKKDYEKRMQFLEQHGDFIPQNLIDSSVINSSTPQISINFDQEPLPAISKEVVQLAKKMLK
ncbi:hypothetical protein KL949_000621 [Ogataea haglerorum]|uniref:Autophagy-related protein 17 n=1 Tax=Ogataea haglerorum TaxID=1937702 RepID=A0ABQ7RNY7_9ASCO|nr:hypothetical protein KL914_000143 [Ogataea haglerorum]KAG7722325.1 hypothetical protein KL913_000145 [Ogataea haglerorum]KAG7723571.1 hypothetical protein KL949_000621 [Ogataea haglerorum]KAG7743004.1 hypothetical protein KL923_000619 [Ogataea haglerorum]KAG7769336.1 hypothetical protein KL946_000619 [Ogataea haglerorum]